jgi:hypothetical protein
MSTTSKLSVTRKGGNGVVARIFFLDLGAGRVLSANPDGSTASSTGAIARACA